MRMEKELKNLEVIDASDNVNKTMKVKRRDNTIQKDFFSAAEYGVYAVKFTFELEYYKKRRKQKHKASSFVFYN
jgi:cobalamin biosynthesis protein CobT